MEKKESAPTCTIEKVKAGHYDTRGFGPRNFGTYNGAEITQEEINNGEWDDVELIQYPEDDFGSLHRDGQKIDGYKKPINKQSAGRKKKRKRKTKRRKSKRRKSKRRKGKRKRRRKTRKHKRRSKNKIVK